jgi:hypothetical protein
MTTYQPGANFHAGNKAALVLGDLADPTQTNNPLTSHTSTGHQALFTRADDQDSTPYQFVTTDAAVIAWLDAMPAGTVTKTVP